MDEATGAVFTADGSKCAGVAGEGKFADFTRGHAETVPLPVRKPKVAAPAPVAEAEEEEDELVAGMGGLAVVEEAVVDVKEAPTRICS